MWVVAEYDSTALFTLKPATATASGGRTLPVPTPFAVKMALLDAACRQQGVEAAARAWQWLNACRVALRPAPYLVVNNTFIKVLKPRRNEASEGSADAGYFGRTITYREYAYMQGNFGLALDVVDEDHAAQVARWLTLINYLGKRGSFIQLLAQPTLQDTLDSGYVVVGEPLTSFDADGLLLQLDDTGVKVTFEQVNIYSSKSLALGKDRILHTVALPYRLIQSSRGYSYYALQAGHNHERV